MKNVNSIFLMYYIYCLILVLGTGYVVFELDNSGWWFLSTLLLCNASPEIKK